MVVRSTVIEGPRVALPHELRQGAESPLARVTSSGQHVAAARLGTPRSRRSRLMDDWVAP